MHPLHPPVQGIGHVQLHIDALFLAIGTLESLASFGKIAQSTNLESPTRLLPAPKSRYQRPSMDSSDL